MKDTVRVILTLLIAAGCGVCAAMAPKDDDDKSPAAKLVDEKVIFKFTGDKDTAPGLDPGSMKLSPDGKRLLYIRRKRLDVGEKGSPTRAYELRLRILAGGEEAVLPIPAYTMDDIPRMMISMNVFDAAGKRIVLGIGVDQNNDGLHDYRKEKMQPAFYDIAKDKITKLDVTNDVVIPTFDRTGKGLIIIAATEQARTGKMYTTPADQIKLRQLALWGLPRSTCPTADVIPLVLPPKRDADGRKKSDFVLYDLTNDKIAARLPIHERNTKLDDYNPQWTADGRYLYYVDVKVAEGGNRRVMLTRIWDRKAGKLAGEIEDAVAVGPGPTKTTMVLDRYGGISSLKIHDAASGKTWKLASEHPIRLTGATGKYILYIRPNEKREKILCRARIALGK